MDGDQLIAEVVWPVTLADLSFGMSFDQPMARELWPTSMRSLTRAGISLLGAVLSACFCGALSLGMVGWGRVDWGRGSRSFYHAEYSSYIISYILFPVLKASARCLTGFWW